MPASIAQEQQPVEKYTVPPNERSDAGAKVTVACKLPAGLVLRAYTERTEREAVLGGGTRESRVYRWDGERQVEIAGTATPFGQAPKTRVLFGYAMTDNVPKDIWDNWYEANKDGALVKNKLVFAFENANKAHDCAKENEKRISGFEPVDPDNPGLKVRGISKSDVRR